MARLSSCCLAATVWLVLNGSATAQTAPLASITGRITDPSGAGIEGVGIEVSSPALQGHRNAATNRAGDFLLRFLPPGDYLVELRRDGFRAVRVETALHAVEMVRLDVQLEVGEFTGSVDASAAPQPAVASAAGVRATLSSRQIEALPTDRSPRGATLLAPGAAPSGPGGNLTIAGAMSNENLYLVNGAEVREMVFGQPRPFPIEDAIEETTTTVSGISAEYGRFTGGLVQVVTRSGGNRHAGTFRTTLRSDSWRALTPYERATFDGDPRDRSVVPTFEATLGGPLLEDRLWYFAAGRRQDARRTRTLAYTDVPYRDRVLETRAEGKLTWAPGPGQSVRLSLGKIDTSEDNALFAPAMDPASLSRFDTPEDLLSLQYSLAIGRFWFVESQLSRRRRAPTGVGARTTDLLDGTVLRDGSRGGASWNSPIFCAVCGVPAGELRRAEEGDRQFVLKASTLRSASRGGSHSLVAGGALADQLRESNSFQSGSGFTVTATSARLVDGEIHPIFLPGGSTVVDWTPILELSRGGRFRTTSAFVQDDWRIGERWSASLGLRWDADDSRDQSGVTVGRSEIWSPRLSLSFRPHGDGPWTFAATAGRYVSDLDFSIGDLGTRRGRPARYSYAYEGPALNAGPDASLVPTREALEKLFDWFFANGGTDRDLRQAAAIPGLRRRVGPGLALPRSEEISLGATRELGERGFLRLAAIRRAYDDIYDLRADLSTGRVEDPASGREYDLILVGNGERVERSFSALVVQLDLPSRRGVRVAGSYTLSSTRGNFDGEGASALGGSTPESDLSYFPEYGEPRWRAPGGPLRNDERHRAHLWALYDVPLADRHGALSLSALERIDSGSARSVVGLIDSRPYVANPGYVAPPARVPYYFEGRGSRRTGTVIATDLAASYSVPVAASGRPELFARIVLLNLFDQVAQTGAGRTGVLTAANDPRLVPFDPFREQPVQGVHWDLAPGFGEPLGVEDFAPTRTWSVSFGVRF